MRNAFALINRYAEKTAYRAVYTTGQGASAVGLANQPITISSKVFVLKTQKKV